MAICSLSSKDLARAFLPACFKLLISTSLDDIMNKSSIKIFPRHRKPIQSIVRTHNGGQYRRGLYRRR